MCFHYGDHWKHPWRDLAGFVLGYLGPELARLVGDAASVAIHVTESGRVQGELIVRPGMVVVTSKAIGRLARAINC